MELRDLRDLFLYELKDLYSAETQILEALPKMAKAATANDLRQAFEEHEKVTEEQLRRIEKIAEKLGENPRGKKCKGMEGLITEGEELLQKHQRGDVLDAALISAAQKVEHYEIASYGTIATYANLMGDNEIAQLLGKTLDEEEATDKKLTKLAESHINKEALNKATPRA